MNTYINGFTRGRELLKKLLVCDLITAFIAVFMRSNPMVVGLFSGATVILFIAIIYIVIKYCRCPNCGKVIMLGVLAVDACPRCKRSFTTGKRVKKGK